MPKALQILKEDPNIPSWWLFDELRKRGIDHIATFSGELWTDHNLHDPGVTMLDVLCYAITDLGYRTNLSIEDLLAPPQGEKENNFFSPEEILTCNPLTITDYRKMLIDISGVRNAWLAPAAQQEVPLYIDCENDLLQFSPVENKDPNIGELILNGLYKVYLDIDPILRFSENNTCSSTANVVDTILREVKQRLHQHRNLCEDFLDIIVLQDEEIGVCADIELNPDADPDVVLEAVYEAIEAFLSPRIPFYSLKERLQSGKSMEEIFEGRPYTPAYGNKNGKHSHGFIDTEELQQSKLPQQLLASDFYRIIMKVEGVRAIKSLLLNNFKDGNPRTDGEAWALALSQNHRPLFSPENSFFNFSKGIIRISSKKEQTINRFKKRLQDFRKNKFNAADLDLMIPYGNHRADLADYKSIQHEFPIVYGIGKGHLSENAPDIRKVEALQLKGYLTFYDQLLAGYMTQLANVRQLYSWDVSSAQMAQTYFQQPVVDIPKAEKIFLSESQSSQEEQFNEGEVIAIPHQPFAHPVERDMAIGQLVELFNSFSDDGKKTIIQTKEEDNGTFRFQVLGNGATVVLQSKKTYDTESDALQAAEILFFQGTIAASYVPVNWPELSEYSFSFVYNVVNYSEYLRQITESEATYFSRKDQFLNHLLARFGEQFTEYVLLMYALNKGAPDPKDIIQDKARFLSNYPDISRNRGRGFNYLDKENIWNSQDNISGFEKRVAGLMGLDNWERQTLNNFEIVLREQQSVLTIKDHRGTVLFETADCYKDGEDIEGLKNTFASLLCDETAYEIFDCIKDRVFGFRLIGPDGKVFANYLRTYGSPTLRDEILLCTQNYFNGYPYLDGTPVALDPNDDPNTKLFLGQIVKIVAEEEGFYFELISDDGMEVYLKSSQPYDTEKEACHAWVEFVQLAKVESNYINLDHPSRGLYSFVIYKEAIEGEEAIPFAYHPIDYSSKTSRTKKRKAISSIVSQKKLAYTIVCHPDFYSWSLMDENDKLLLNSIHRFKNPKQAFDSWKHFITYGAERTNSRKVDTAEGFEFTIYKEEVALATSPVYPTDEERNAAREVVLALVKKEVLTTVDELQVKIETHPGQFYFILRGEKDQPALIGQQTFESKVAAACGYFDFLDKASSGNYYKEVVQEGTCLFSFKVKDAGIDLAYHPTFYLKEEKDAVQSNLINYINQNKVPFKIELLPGFFHYEICWENCEGQCEPLLIENEGHDSALKAQEQVLDFLANYDPTNSEQWILLEEENQFGFGIGVKNNLEVDLLSKHKQYFSTKDQRNKVLADAQGFFEFYTELINDPNTFFDELIEPISKWEICGDSCIEEESSTSCLLSSFRLSKTENPIAYHPTIFDEPLLQQQKSQQLLLKAQCDEIVYTDLCIKGSKVVFKWIDEKKEKFYYELWDNKTEALLWRSFNYYNTFSEAAAAFENNWLSINELAKNKNNYKLPETDFPYLSLWKETEKIAYHPITLDTTSEAEVIKEMLIKVAMQYPIYTQKDKYHFHLLNEDCSKVWWESSQAYDSISDAINGFTFFLPLLKKQANYRKNNDKETCIFKIEIVETLLEGDRTYADVFITNNVNLIEKDFTTEDEARNQIQELYQSLQALSSLQINFENHLIKSNDRYFYRFETKTTQINPAITYRWKSEEGYGSQLEAIQRLRELQRRKFKLGNFLIRQDAQTNRYYIVIDNRYIDASDQTISEDTTKFVACPAIFESDEIMVGELPVIVAEDCNEFDSASCVQTICPAAWDQGLQSFLVYAINNEHYYTFIDYHHDCQFGFRVVTDKYRLARNVEEFHLPAHQAQFKDWLYGYSRCDKEVNKDLPKAKIFKKNGFYHFCMEGNATKVTWCRSTDFLDDAQGRKDLVDQFNEEYLELICKAKRHKNYDLKPVDINGDTLYQIEIVLADSTIVTSPNSKDDLYPTEEVAEAAIQCSMLYARTMYPIFLEEKAQDNKPVYVIQKSDNNLLSYCISIPELLWASFQGYGTKKEALLAYNEQIYDFYAYAQEIDFYELKKGEVPNAGQYLHLLKEDCSIMAVSFQTFQNATEWNEAVLQRILQARKFPYFKFDGKFGFQCFALIDPPILTWRERTACDPPAIESPALPNCESDNLDTIVVDIPGKVIWESIDEYNTPADVECAFGAFLGLLKDKANYQAIQLEDCNLFGLEITHPNQVLATHPQRYYTKKEVQAAIDRAQDCINIEGFHLVEHILLRPKEGVSNHITVQFSASENMDCLDEDGHPILVEKPYLILNKIYTNEEEASMAKAELQSSLETCLQSNMDKTGILNSIGFKAKCGRLNKNDVVAKNCDLLINLLTVKVTTAVADSTLIYSENKWVFPPDFFDQLFFCFNKSSSGKEDKLISICPDCECPEYLPKEKPSTAACVDPKQLLKTPSSDSSSEEANILGDYYVAGADPYSFWTTIVLPYWPNRFQNANFRNFFQDTLRREAPAHIGLRICWLDPKQMRRFERAYRDWLEALSGNQNCNLQEAQHRLICILFDEEDGISNVYPPARLQEGDCEAGGVFDPGAVLLDFTQLG